MVICWLCCYMTTKEKLIVHDDQIIIIIKELINCFVLAYQVTIYVYDGIRQNNID
jgi:hypothetical protein